MLNPFAIPLRTAPSEAKGLRVNFVKHPCSSLNITAGVLFPRLRDQDDDYQCSISATRHTSGWRLKA